MTTPFWTDSRKDLLNSRFTMQKQAEEIEELRELVIRQSGILADQAASIAEGDEVIDELHAKIDKLQEVIDRAWAHLDFGHVAIARNILAAHISQPKYQRRIT